MLQVVTEAIADTAGAWEAEARQQEAAARLHVALRFGLLLHEAGRGVVLQEWGETGIGRMTKVDLRKRVRKMGSQPYNQGVGGCHMRVVAICGSLPYEGGCHMRIVAILGSLTY